jgi:DNA-binding NarL/FixJ family response regulator
MEMVMLAITEANVSKLDTDSRQSGHGQAEGRCSMKILVVDDHFLIRDALRSVLKKLKSDATILEAVNAYQALQLVSEHADIGLVLLELNLPDRDGFSVLSELRERHPTMSVVVLSARQDRNSVVRALNLGALGFIPKSGQLAIMLSALDLVFAGGVYVPPEILLCEQRSPPIPKLASIAPGARPVRPAELGLTERQVDVLALMMKGKSNKMISRMLNLAVPTVKNHVTAILKAIKVTNRTEAVIAVTDLGCERPLVNGATRIQCGVRSRSLNSTRCRTA